MATHDDTGCYATSSTSVVYTALQTAETQGNSGQQW